MVNDYTVDKVLDKIKEILGTEEFDDTKILINADDKLPDDISLKRFAISLPCAINPLSAIVALI